MKKQVIIIALASLIMMTIFYLNPSPSSVDSVSLDRYVENEYEVTEIEGEKTLKKKPSIISWMLKVKLDFLVCMRLKSIYECMM